MDLLRELTDGAVEDAKLRERSLPFEALRALAEQARQPIDAVSALSPSESVHVIAEVKRASPSKGLLSDIPDPAELAGEYARGGASCISVLTESRRFKGSLEDLRAVRAEVSVPVLRKDFIATEYQLLEAREAGADIVLLIASVLDAARLRELHAYAEALGLSVLVEVHDESEIDRAVAAGAKILGVNTRDLKTFEMHPERFAELRSLIPDGVIAVAESGVHDVDDVQRYRNDGAHAVLVGETLVRDGAPRARVAEFGGVR
ncbi:MAG TPA: indole-3-glycerol phosphate synthase TrpC [Candidatus Agrococcus pullicola]|uniref:Indole-3-glycerol phosphate synthase n=1 Tax=Candidatus Agrococcus pullicola TaxID=2838429 RepID=A0A9D1YTE9_9MICO|nr:indole-3-glycerol phosphate synthase TrpC [Candidatus Agrococcus pullicola]